MSAQDRRSEATPSARPVNGRARVPAPRLKTRLPSGRGAIEQPNASRDGDAPLNARFWVALALTGVERCRCSEQKLGAERAVFGITSSTGTGPSPGPDAVTPGRLVTAAAVPTCYRAGPCWRPARTPTTSRLVSARRSPGPVGSARRSPSCPTHTGGLDAPPDRP